MPEPKNNKKGYVRGLGRTFAPSQKADWVDEFNQMLIDKPEWSRNRLTEHLIKKGLEQERNHYLNLPIPAEGLTEEQKEFLESEEGRIFVGNAIRLLLMRPGTNESHASHPVFSPLPEKEAGSTEEHVVIEEEEKDNEVEPLPKEESSDTSLPDEEKKAPQEEEKPPKKDTKLSPLMRARNKLKRQNLNG